MKKEVHSSGGNVRSVLKDWISEIDGPGVFGLLQKNEYLITISDYKLTRSIAQNKLMWLWIKLIAEDTGDTENDVHAYINSNFITQEEKEVLGKLVNTSKTTSKLNTKEFTVMLNEFERHMNEFLEWDLPRPEDIYDLAVYGAKKKGK